MPDHFPEDSPGAAPAAAGRFAEAPVHLLKGFCMGSADIIPGVSGGTMALILGIYERLLAAIRAFDFNWLRDVVSLRWGSALEKVDFKFLFPLLFGILSAILFFTRVVPLPELIVSHPEMVYGLFFGLILASIIVLMGEVERFGAREIAISVAGVALGLAIVNLVPVDTPSAAWFIFLCGFVAICAMLLPGISGSFILLILGKYAFIINALGQMDWLVIGVFVAGAVAGLVSFSRVITWLLQHYHQPTLLVIKGILIGSLWDIWPFQHRTYAVVGGEDLLVGTRPMWPESLSSTVLLSLLLAVAGFLLVTAIHRMAGRKVSS